jgi:CheY-like chemotaxis protein
MTNLNGEKQRILMVEDHEDAREIVAFCLEEYTLIYARNFDEGVRLARRGYFDLYISDNWLPGGDGVEMCRRIREFDPHTRRPTERGVKNKGDICKKFVALLSAYAKRSLDSSMPNTDLRGRKLRRMFMVAMRLTVMMLWR